MNRLLAFVAGAVALLTTSGVQAFMKGHDLSSVGLMETKEGASWYGTDGKTHSIENLLGSGGMNSVRLRLWTSGDYDLTYTLNLAKRFSSAGYQIFLDMHFSDNWADGGHQAVPKGWSTSSVSSLANSLRSYVKSTLETFTRNGVRISVLSLGNEIQAGMLYPYGQINNGDFRNFATLWKAARNGVNDAVQTGTSKPQVMIHLDNGWKNDRIPWLQNFFKAGIVSQNDVDALGFSYYPFYGTGATISTLSSTLNSMANTFRKPIYIAETDYPNKCTKVQLSANYPASAAGQVQWTKAVIDVLQRLPNGLGQGIFYWEPAYIKVAGLGSQCESALLFDVDWTNWPKTKATALSSVNLYR